MSYDDPEEELLDQHLREAFSEFELPPANRVWKGIEGRIGTLPGAAQPLIPLKFLLPAVALAGVAAGWIFSPSAPTMPPAKPTVSYTPPAQAVPASPLPEAPVLVPAAQIRSITPNLATSTTRQRWAASSRLAQRPAVEPLAPQLPELTLASGPNHAGLPVPAISGKAPAYWDTVSAVGVESSVVLGPVAAPPSAAAETPKADGPKSFHAEFRQPTHRRAEKGRGIRRHLSAVGQWARHLMSPRRTRTTGQPNF